jgi:hypothetical protein
VELVVEPLAALDRQPELMAAVNNPPSQTFGRIFGPRFLKRQQIFQPEELGTPQELSLAEAVGLAVLAFLAKAATEATVVLMGPTQPATVLEVAEVAAQQTEGTDLMDTCGLHTGALTDGNF